MNRRAFIASIIAIPAGVAAATLNTPPAANTGLTLAKLQRFKSLLEANEMPTPKDYRLLVTTKGLRAHGVRPIEIQSARRTGILALDSGGTTISTPVMFAESFPTWTT